MKYVIGLDYGTDSVRALIADTADGREVSSAVFYYPRWKAGKYCEPGASQFRQHPLDYLEGLEHAIKNALAQAPAGVAKNVVGISVDTTGSTPVAVDKNGTPLALLPEFAENPHGMFILWKDHTANAEAEEINTLAHRWDPDFTKYVGGIYSSEWFWAKILRTLRVDEAVREAAFSWVEHCDWVSAVLTGDTNPLTIKRSRCAAGHKAMWHEEFEGLPSEAFLTHLDPLLAGLRERLFRHTYTADVPMGTLSKDWAARLGLPENVVVGVGAFDAHMGAVGAGIEPYSLVRVMGTSTCDMLVAPNEEVGHLLIRGICGQVDGSILPGMLGMEAGQSAFGDVYAWFQNLLAWPMRELLSDEEAEKLVQKIIPALSEKAAALPVSEHDAVALDWFNGRRTPDANHTLKGAISGLNLGSDAPRIFKALVEATAFGAKKIVERFQSEGVPIRQVIGIGGVSKKSPFVMQTLANVLNMPIKIVQSEQACALGAAICAATAAGVYPNILAAKAAMASGYDAEFQPQADKVAVYEKLYRKYGALGGFVEKQTGETNSLNDRTQNIMEMKVKKRLLVLMLCSLFVVSLPWFACRPKLAATSTGNFKKEVVFRNPADSTQNIYLALVPEQSIKGLLVILPGFGSFPPQVLIETQLPEAAAKKGYVVIVPLLVPYGVADTANLYQSRLKELIPEVLAKYAIPSGHFVLGGHSLGGHEALFYAEKALADDSQKTLRPQFVFGVDPPLDLKRLYRNYQRLIDLNPALAKDSEAAFIMERFQALYGGTPDTQPARYTAASSFSADAPEGGNARYLCHSKLPVRLYSDPDSTWYQQ